MKVRIFYPEGSSLFAQVRDGWRFYHVDESEAQSHIDGGWSIYATISELLLDFKDVEGIPESLGRFKLVDEGQENHVSFADYSDD